MLPASADAASRGSTCRGTGASRMSKAVSTPKRHASPPLLPFRSYNGHVSGTMHMHCPSPHCLSNEHSLPHQPQLVFSFIKSWQTPSSQRVSPTPQAVWQIPSLHTCPSAQMVPGMPPSAGVQTNASTGAPTSVSTGASTDVFTDASTNAPTDASTDAASTDAFTGASPDTLTGASTRASTGASTDAFMDVSTDASGPTGVLTSGICCVSAGVSARFASSLEEEEELPQATLLSSPRSPASANAVIPRGRPPENSSLLESE